MADTSNKPVAFDSKWCKGCGICIEFCPKDVLEFDEKGKPTVIKPEECTRCKLCELRCPDFAIVVKGDEDDE